MEAILTYDAAPTFVFCFRIFVEVVHSELCNGIRIDITLSNLSLYHVDFS